MPCTALLEELVTFANKIEVVRIVQNAYFLSALPIHRFVLGEGIEA